jgi:hypothetical protein
VRAMDAENVRTGSKLLAAMALRAIIAAEV